MPADIYGQPLRAGYCEVHPDTRGTYPCEQCEDDYWTDRRAEYKAECDAEYAALCEAEYNAHCRAEFYRARAWEWLDHNYNSRQLPDWWWQR